MEIWKDIPGYEGRYQASNMGNIKSISLYGRRGFIRKQNKLLKQFNDKDGYNEICLCKNNNKKTYKVHYLILKTFFSDRPIINNEIMQINHKDGNKKNNKLDNLEYCTQSENQLHKYKVLGYKGVKTALGRKGKLHKRSISVGQYNLDGDLINTFESINLASIHTGISGVLISRCINKKQKYTFGNIWMKT